jgi:hypothetical protein
VAFSRETSEKQVAYHKLKGLQEISWQGTEAFSYADSLADFRGKFHDIRSDPLFVNCLIQAATAPYNIGPESFLKQDRPASTIPAFGTKSGHASPVSDWHR